jgi:hypothetical protein
VRISRDVAENIIHQIDPEIKVVYRGYRGYCRPRRKIITLPISNLKNTRSMRGKLRLGIVLHELCHFVSLKHDKVFVGALDELLVVYKPWLK